MVNQTACIQPSRPDRGYVLICTSPALLVVWFPFSAKMAPKLTNRSRRSPVPSQSLSRQLPADLFLSACSRVEGASPFLAELVLPVWLVFGDAPMSGLYLSFHTTASERANKRCPCNSQFASDVNFFCSLLSQADFANDWNLKHTCFTVTIIGLSFRTLSFGCH